MFAEDVYTYARYGAFLWHLILASSAYLVLRTVIFFRNRQKKYQLLKECGIPGPEPSLWSSNMDQTLYDDLCLYKAEDEIKRYGKTFGGFIGDYPIVTTTDLDLCKKIFVDPNPYFLDKTVDILETHLTHSIFFSSYPRWKIMRKTLAPTFTKFTVHSPKSKEAIEDSINMMMAYLDKKFERMAVNGKLEMNLQDLLKSTTLHLINDLVSELPDIEVKENEPHVKSLDGFLAVGTTKGIVDLAIKFPLLKPLFQFIYDNFELSNFLGAIEKKVNQTIEEQTAKLRKQLNNNDESDEKVIYKLTKLHHENKLTRKEVIGNIEAILIGGYDTTSTQLTYIFWALAKHPEIQEELRADVINNGPESEYLDRVIKETLRLYPSNVLFSTRVANDTVKFDNITIPKGARVTYNHFYMNRNPEIWKEPLKFDPSRFEGDAVSKLHPAAYSPFGFGIHKCLGALLAELEMKTVITAILTKYRIHLKRPHELTMKIFTVFLTEPTQKIILDLEKLDLGTSEA